MRGTIVYRLQATDHRFMLRRRAKPVACTKIFSRWFALHLTPNPNGVVSHSPGLRASRYPGKWSHRMINPNGVVSSCLNPTSLLCLSFVLFRSIFCHNARHSSGHNPVGVEMRNRSFPRVARCAQPWAMGRNPVGIRERKNLTLQRRFRQRSVPSPRCYAFPRLDYKLIHWRHCHPRLGY
jgi:hypothetical protein